VKHSFFQLAEGVGFEPTFAKKAKAVFKTATISHSVTPPGFKFYFKSTSSGNLADLLQASLPDFGPTWMIYELVGQASQMTGGMS
jgi:hypothetical protein